MRIALTTCLLAVVLAPSGRALGQQGVPDHYPALRTYVEGEILEVSSDGLAILIQQGQPLERMDPRNRDPRDGARGSASDPFSTPGRGSVLVKIADVSGWVFIDDPEGGPQQRARLDEARVRFVPGLQIEIGPAPGLESTASEGWGQTQSSRPGSFSSVQTPRSLTIRGWIYIRLSDWRDIDGG